MTAPIAIIGLGNPGRSYGSTRHNVGFMVLDTFLKDPSVKVDKEEKEKDLAVAWINVRGHKHVSLRPLSFMNESGIPLQRFISYHKITTDRMIVIHDDLDLPFGEIRKSFDRGDAGHQGVASLIAQLGSKSFHRFRVGIGSNRPHGIPAEDYVLQKFSKEEMATLNEKIIPDAVQMIAQFVTDSLPSDK